MIKAYINKPYKRSRIASRFFVNCLFEWKIQFAVEKKTVFWDNFKITFKIFSLSPSKKSWSYNFHEWKLYDKHFFDKKFFFCFWYDIPTFLPKQESVLRNSISTFFI